MACVPRRTGYSNTIVNLGITSMATTLTSKGQVTIPQKVREFLGLSPGSQVDFELTATGEVLLRPAKRRAGKPISRFGKLRGRATVKMRTEQILALTRGEP